MHSPLPYGLFTHGEPPSKEDLAFADSLARDLTNLRQTSDLPSLRLRRELPGGGTVTAQWVAGTFRVFMDKPAAQDAPPDEVARLPVPLLFSGVITKPVVPLGAGVEMTLTETTARRVAAYSDTPAPVQQKLQRFAIPYSDRHAEFRPEPGESANPPVYTQYTGLRPTWFSGAMATLVQVVSGYGRQDVKNLPNTPVERATIKLPKDVLRAAAKELGKQRLPGYTGVAPASGEIQYDYKWAECHGVSFSPNGQPWLLRVSAQGVYAMPLPLSPVSTTKAFRQYVEDKGDQELLWLLNLYGGVPTGESFPAEKGAFSHWLRAGVITKVCNMGNYYSGVPYSETHGWAFNTRGTEGYNTCYTYDDDSVQLGLAYSMRLAMGEAPNRGVVAGPPTIPGDGALTKAFRAYLAAVEAVISRNARGDAVRYKLWRAGVQGILPRVSGDPPTTDQAVKEVEWWDALEMDSIAACTGSVRETARGNLYASGPPKSQPQIKFPIVSPALKGCVSHDFSPAKEHAVPVGYTVKCDTIMYGYYVGDDLRVVKYFLDTTRVAAGVESDAEDCMYVGSWTRTTTSGVVSLMGHFYTTDVDARKEGAEVTEVEKIVGTDMGYDSQPYFKYDHFFSMVGTMWRNRYAQHQVSTTRTEGYGIQLAVCQPYMHRGVVLHARREWTSGGSSSTGNQLLAERDPNSYRFRTYDFIWAWVGGDYSGNQDTAYKVDPEPKDGNPVWVQGYNYDPGPCSDFADQGDWVGSLPRDYTWLIHPNRNVWQHEGGGGPPKLRLYSTSKHLDATKEGELLFCGLPGAAQHVDKNPAEGFFTVSPDEYGGVFYIDAMRLTAGEAEYTCLGARNDAGRSAFWGYTELAPDGGNFPFIGVING